MKLWADTDAINSAGRAVQIKVSEMTADINHQARSRGAKAVNALRSAERKVLMGQRSGKKYRKPYTGSKTREERKKSGYKPPEYTASKPGEPPARRSGNLRLHWNGDVKSRDKPDGGVEVVAELESGEKYAWYLEKGTKDKNGGNEGEKTKKVKGMEARPFVEKIKEKAMPEIKKIYNEPYK